MTAPEGKPSLRERLANFGKAFTATRELDPRLVPIMVVVGVGVLAVGIVGGLVLGSPVIGGILGLLLGLLGMLFVFGQRSASASIEAIEGRPGAAAAVLQSLGRGWRLTPAVAVTRKQDLVHRVVGRPGVVLVGEGSSARVTALLKQERRRYQRAVGEIPVHEVRVGNGQDEVALKQLRLHVMRLPRALKPAAVGALEVKLAALADTDLPLPKGPMPRGRIR